VETFTGDQRMKVHEQRESNRSKNREKMIPNFKSHYQNRSVNYEGNNNNFVERMTGDQHFKLHQEREERRS
jgi:hypothetical protein